MKYQGLPAEGFAKLPAILHAVGVSKSAWYRGVKDGVYPKSVHLGKRSVAWRVSDIRALIEKISKQAA